MYIYTHTQLYLAVSSPPACGGEPGHGEFRRGAGHGRQRCGQLCSAGPGKEETQLCGHMIHI